MGGWREVRQPRYLVEQQQRREGGREAGVEGGLALLTGGLGWVGGWGEG